MAIRAVNERPATDKGVAAKVRSPGTAVAVAGAIAVAALALFLLHRGDRREGAGNREGAQVGALATEHRQPVRAGGSAYSVHNMPLLTSRHIPENTVATSSNDTVYQLGTALGEVSGAHLSRSKGTIAFDQIQAKPSFDINEDFNYRGYTLHHVQNPIEPGTPGGELDEVVSIGPTQVVIFDNVYTKIVGRPR
jgi:hypothetical protein